MDTAEEVRANLTEMVMGWDFGDPEQNDNALAARMEVERIYQLARIADALTKIEETGVYNWPSWPEEKGPKSDTIQSELGEPQGRRRG